MSAPAGTGRDRLDAGSISAAFERFARGFSPPVLVLGETTSTNDEAKRLAREGTPSGTLVVAEAQTAGRGRGGSAWFSPPGDSLYASVVVRPTFDAASGAPYTLAVGVAVAKALEARLSHGRVGIKWPNDVWVGERKLAGILVEGQVRGTEVTSLVVGIGINVHTREFPPPLDAIATSLAIAGARDLRRNVLAAELSARVVAAAALFGERGLAPFLDDVASRDLLKGRSVRVGDVTGRAAGITAEGELRITTEPGSEALVASGHVELLAD